MLVLRIHDYEAVNTRTLRRSDVTVKCFRDQGLAMTMITVPPRVKAAARLPHPLFRIMIEERYRIYRQLLEQLAAYSRMPNRGGYEPAALAAMLRRASGGVADSANALKHISDGTYGPCERCGRGIPPGRLRMRPEARYCVSCELLLATGAGVDTTADIEPAGVDDALSESPRMSADVLVTTESSRQQAAAKGTCAARPSGTTSGPTVATPPRTGRRPPGRATKGQ
jgi:DnaK suppressor protein